MKQDVVKHAAIIPDGILNCHGIDPHIGNAIHKYLNVHQKALEVLVQSQFRQQPVVELSAF